MLPLSGIRVGRCIAALVLLSQCCLPSTGSEPDLQNLRRIRTRPELPVAGPDLASESGLQGHVQECLYLQRRRYGAREEHVPLPVPLPLPLAGPLGDW